MEPLIPTLRLPFSQPGATPGRESNPQMFCTSAVRYAALEGTYLLRHCLTGPRPVACCRRVPDTGTDLCLSLYLAPIRLAITVSNPVRSVANCDDSRRFGWTSLRPTYRSVHATS